MPHEPVAAARWLMTGGRRLALAPCIVAGIVNITPDSFSDGGCCFEPRQAMSRVRQVLADGAAMVDIGAESTRPGALDIGHKEEWRRLEPVLKDTLLLRETMSDGTKNGELPFAVSVDTFRAATAAKALDLGVRGADVINDISGGAFDPAMDEVLAAHKPGYVLGHSPARPAVMQNKPRYQDVVGEILDWFTGRMNALVKAGLPEDRIALDPGIGFGKTLEHTMTIFAALNRFAALGRPLYFGISRKSFIGAITGLECAERDAPTQVFTACLAAGGVYAHRVHNVAQAVATLKITALLGQNSRLRASQENVEQE